MTRALVGAIAIITLAVMIGTYGPRITAAILGIAAAVAAFGVAVGLLRFRVTRECGGRRPADSGSCDTPAVRPDSDRRAA